MIATIAEPAKKPKVAVGCKGVTKTYGKGSNAVYALRGVDLEIYPGELFMLVGPSGCGKTTLISIIAGVLDRDGGECSVFDHDYKKMTPDETTRFRGINIGFCFQAFNLIPALTAAENVATPLIINGMKPRMAVEQGCKILAQVGLDERIMRSLPMDLSGGQQQRVAIARSLAHNPHLIVCDEPTSALDGETGHKVMELLRKLALATNRALVVVTHDARVFEFADRIATMEDGRITRVVDSPQDLESTKESSL
ncbi:MAG TPA: ABC transporter ATP-binding protein [Candidatus Methylacidiphilales bacterium]|nr:ABC transporter ATP-binding protein [Candidatus Methylacidiphilales bacterium]